MEKDPSGKEVLEFVEFGYKGRSLEQKPEFVQWAIGPAESSTQPARSQYKKDPAPVIASGQS